MDFPTPAISQTLNLGLVFSKRLLSYNKYVTIQKCIPIIYENIFQGAISVHSGSGVALVDQEHHVAVRYACMDFKIQEIPQLHSNRVDRVDGGVPSIRIHPEAEGEISIALCKKNTVPSYRDKNNVYAFNKSKTL